MYRFKEGDKVWFVVANKPLPGRIMSCHVMAEVELTEDVWRVCGTVKILAYPNKFIMKFGFDDARIGEIKELDCSFWSPDVGRELADDIGGMSWHSEPSSVKAVVKSVKPTYRVRGQYEGCPDIDKDDSVGENYSPVDDDRICRRGD